MFNFVVVYGGDICVMYCMLKNNKSWNLLIEMSEEKKNYLLEWK